MRLFGLRPLVTALAEVRPPAAAPAARGYPRSPWQAGVVDRHVTGKADGYHRLVTGWRALLRRAGPGANVTSPTIDAIRQRGHLYCGVDPGVHGYASQDSRGGGGLA
jgi:hypothetical protein